MANARAINVSYSLTSARTGSCCSAGAGLGSNTERNCDESPINMWDRRRRLDVCHDARSVRRDERGGQRPVVEQLAAPWRPTPRKSRQALRESRSKLRQSRQALREPRSALRQSRPSLREPRSAPRRPAPYRSAAARQSPRLTNDRTACRDVPRVSRASRHYAAGNCSALSTSAFVVHINARYQELAFEPDNRDLASGIAVHDAGIVFASGALLGHRCSRPRPSPDYRVLASSSAFKGFLFEYDRFCLSAFMLRASSRPIEKSPALSHSRPLSSQPELSRTLFVLPRSSL